MGDASQWRAGVPTYGRVTSADPHPIRVAFEGVDRLDLDDKGALVLETEGGQLVPHPPVVYQESDGRRQPVTAG